MLQAAKLNLSSKIRFAPREEAWRYLFLTMSYYSEGEKENAGKTFQSFERWMKGQDQPGLIGDLEPLIDEVQRLMAGETG